MPVIIRPARVCMETTPCPECSAGRSTWCLLADGIGVHPARVRAWQTAHDPEQHDRAVAARKRLENIERDVVTAAACACGNCPSAVELTEWLGGLGLLTPTTTDDVA